MPNATRPEMHEADLVSRAKARDPAAIREIITANNRRLYRVARSIVADNAEAEDVLQNAYLRAFSGLEGFRSDASLTTWLTRIVINEALQYKRRKVDLPVGHEAKVLDSSAQIIPWPHADYDSTDPERVMAQHEICRLLERAIDDLPEEFRSVLIARTLEDMSIEETADLLGVKPETVKTRLHRARAMLRAALAEHIEPQFANVFPFDGARCARLTEAVLRRLEIETPGT